MTTSNSNTTLSRTVGNGALAGAGAGLAGAAAMYWLAEPSIRAAIAIEEAGSHTHGADDLVSRSEQVGYGLVTVLVVGTLIGVAFALAHRFLGSRLPGRSAAGSAMALAGLGFVALTLAPALLIPANPPAVGDPGTVDLRTFTYLGAIVGAVALTALVTTAARTKSLAPAGRIAVSTALAIAGTAALIWALPAAADPIPAAIPAQLIWEFRVGSLAQLGLMWLVLGAVFACLTQVSAKSRARALSPDSADQLTGV